MTTLSECSRSLESQPGATTRQGFVRRQRRLQIAHIDSRYDRGGSVMQQAKTYF